MAERETNHSDLRLLELAARNPSLGGRALLQEIIERGSAPEAGEPPRVNDSFVAFASHELDHPDYRTPIEQANWLHAQSQMQRDMYERGATIKGDVLVMPVEEYELDEEREQPFITTLAYALRKLGDPEQAREFHALAHTVSGPSADARTQITVFKNYYDRLTGDEQGGRVAPRSESEKAIVLMQTLAEMRQLAAEMEKLETHESIELTNEREEDVAAMRVNAAARRIPLHEEALRLPAGLRYEQKERLITVTIPEIDRRLEQGVRREAIFSAIDHTLRQPDMVAYQRRLMELTGKTANEKTDQTLSRAEYVESQRTLLELSEHEAGRLRELKVIRANEWFPHEDAHLQQVSRLAQRLRQGLGMDAKKAEPERAANSRLYVSLPETADRLPVSSIKVYETMAKIAASERLTIRTWAGSTGPEISPALSERELAEHNRIGIFLKSYVIERLRDPETRLLNTSPTFRDARADLFKATTPEDLGRTAAQLLRDNERNSEEWRKHFATPHSFPPPAISPLNRLERDLLFAGRAPDHHTSEMRELRLFYGLSRQQRAARTADLHAGKLEPSATLKTLLTELDSRATAKAVAHFQASLLNEKVKSEGRLNLNLLSHRIPPHERAFLYERSEERKRDFTRSITADRINVEQEPNQFVQGSTKRAFGVAPKESPTFRTYLASMGRIERTLLNEALQARGVAFDGTETQQDQRGLSITEARQLLPTSLQKEIRLRARNEAWQNLIPAEVFERNPTSAAMRVSETIVHIQEHLQERASLAQVARDEFAQGQAKHSIGGRQINGHEAAAHQWKALNLYAAATREEVYRAFEQMDELRREFAKPRDYALPETREEIDSRLHKLSTQPQAVTTSINAPAWQHIATDHKWHFDDLRATLNHHSSPRTDETRITQPEHNFEPER